MADGNITVEVSTHATQAELRRLRVENAALKRDLQYARDGLTKGRTRMREDVTRLQAEVEQLRAKNEALAREAHAWWTAARDAAKAERALCAWRCTLSTQSRRTLIAGTTRPGRTLPRRCGRWVTMLAWSWGLTCW